MSGPLSSNEIEDVVSSVRRLVSVDVRQGPASGEAVPDRLVLTPSFRIVAEQAAISPLILTERAPDRDDPVVAAPSFATLPDPDEAAMAVDVEADWEDDLWSDPDQSLAEIALVAEEAELVQTVDSAAGDSVQPDDEPLSWARFQPEGKVDPDPEFVLAPAAKPARRPVSAKAAKVGPAKAGSGRRPTASGRAKGRVAASKPVAETAAKPVPGLVAAPADHPGKSFRTDFDPGLAADPVADPVYAPSTLPQNLMDTDGNPLTVLDESALHDIIRQLIREELKGALGERITHNVRKLVRAEINRALTARSLD